MKRILNSQAGFSIVQVLIAAGLMGGLALMMAKLGQNQAKMQRKAVEDQDLNQFVNTVQKHLLNHDACKNTFENVVGLNSDGDDDDEHVDKILNFEKNTVFAVNTTSNYQDTDPSPNLKITSMRAIRGAGTELKLEIEIEKTNKGAQQSFGAKTFKKFIKLDALYSNGEVSKCYSQMGSAVVTARKRACDDLAISAGASNMTTWSATGGCMLSDAYKKKIFEDGLAQMNVTPVFINSSGLLSTVPPREKVRCTLNHKRCSRTNYQDCTPACPSGYHNAGRASGRYDVREGIANKKCCRDYWCQKTNNDGNLLLN